MFGDKLGNIGGTAGEVIQPLVDWTEDVGDDFGPIANHVSQEAKDAGIKIIAVVDDIASQIEGGIDALLNDLNKLPQAIVNTIQEFFTAVKSLKDTHARILELNNLIKSSDLPLKDLMNSEENKRYAWEMAEKTMIHFQILNRVISLLKTLCDLLGNDLRDKLRQCDPLMSKWLSL